MGCDIHVYLAAKDSDSDVSYHTIGLYTSNEDGGLELCSAYTGRDYVLFGLLTGGIVRCNIPDDVPQMPTPKGEWAFAPRNIRYDRASYGCDGHSDTYFTMKELRNLQFKLLSEDGNYDEDYVESINSFVESIGYYRNFCYDYSLDEDVMVICWFDS